MELVVIDTAHASFCIGDAYYRSFLFCIFLPGNMLTLANLSRVPISTGTLGTTVIYWDFSSSSGLFGGLSPPTGLQGLIAPFFCPATWLESFSFWHSLWVGIHFIRNSLIPSFARIFLRTNCKSSRHYRSRNSSIA